MRTAQVTWLDVLPKQLELGYLEDDEVDKYLGEEIPVKELKNYVGHRVILKMPRQSAVDYKCIHILKWIDDDHAYSREGVKFGRVCFTHDKRLRDIGASASEAAFDSARYNYAISAFRIKEVEQ